MGKQYLSAKEAAEELGISVATLYAYVSRGLVRSEAVGGKSRARRYNSSDIAQLKRKQQYRHSPDKVAQTTLQRGMPVLDSAITLIEDGQLLYRGHSALELAQTRSFEEVAMLLWSGSFALSGLFDPQEENPLVLPDWGRELSSMTRFQMMLPLAAEQDIRAYDQTIGGLHRSGARIIRLLTRLVVGRAEFATVAQALQQHWVPNQPDLQRPIEAALILCADHELNVSAFTGRCIASAGSTLYQVVQGGLAALKGFRHGGHTERVAALFDQVASNPQEKLIAHIKRGEPLPGFHHPLYPQGDPRGRLLLSLAETHQRFSAPIKTSHIINETVWQSLARYPTIDFGLVTLGKALGLPPEAPLTLFALGRTAGWIAHALEQYQSGQLIRPRARYIGGKRRPSLDVDFAIQYLTIFSNHRSRLCERSSQLLQKHSQQEHRYDTTQLNITLVRTRSARTARLTRLANLS